MKVTRRQVLAMIGFVVISLLLVLAASCCLEQQTAEVSVEPQAAQEPVEKTFVANEFCAACHYGFNEEKLASSHEKAGIGCERCHGESERHRSDEDNVTSPEIMYPKEKINPTCMMCHPRHEIEHIELHARLLKGAKTIFDPALENASHHMHCTDCHARHHRIDVRTIRWNKATGELLEE